MFVFVANLKQITWFTMCSTPLFTEAWNTPPRGNKTKRGPACWWWWCGSGGGDVRALPAPLQTRVGWTTESDPDRRRQESILTPFLLECRWRRRWQWRGSASPEGGSSRREDETNAPGRRGMMPACALPDNPAGGFSNDFPRGCCHRCRLHSCFCNVWLRLYLIL